MNIRNLFFTSMIFCAASSFATASDFVKTSQPSPTAMAGKLSDRTADRPKINIHDQARSFFLVHKKLIQILPPKLQELMKQYISLKKEFFQSNLDKKCVDLLYQEDNWRLSVDKLIEKSNLSMDEKNALDYTCLMLECYLGHIGILSFDGIFHKDLSVTKEDDVVIIKKRIAYLSSLLESCNVASKVTDSKQNFIVQAQEIILNGYVNFIKAQCPELRRYIKDKFFIKKRMRELALKEMKIGRSIEDINQKIVAIEMDLKRAIDNSTLDHMSLNEIWALYIIEVFWGFPVFKIIGGIESSSTIESSSKKEVTEKDIADEKKIVEYLSSVLGYL